MVFSTSLLSEQIEEFALLVKHLETVSSDGQKCSFLKQLPDVQSFLVKHPALTTKLQGLSVKEQVHLLSLLAIRQGESLFHGFTGEKNVAFTHLLRLLENVATFYHPLGGIIGYHLTVLRLLFEKKEKKKQENAFDYLQPEGFDISSENGEVRKAIRWGIQNLDQMAEIYPLGGAGDRLQLICNIEQEPLPVAQLLFLGRTLLEGLIRDVQAREYLYYKITGKKITIPIAIMTSQEKRNHQRVVKIFESNQWFGRPKESFRFFLQPLVPMIDEEGNWVIKKALTLMEKPGGHGVIWKLALDTGVLDWLALAKKTKILIRQINNPAAGVDYGLLAFLGLGTHYNKLFGFASCPRMPHAAEGTDVLVERKEGNGYTYSISNIEYTDFEKKGISDQPVSDEYPYSCFPANTNILFADVEEIRRQVRQHPIPGMILNMKNYVEIEDGSGDKIKRRAGRLESTMQNISDTIVNTFAKPLPEGERNQLSSYITFNQRKKTLSVAKNSYFPGKPLIGTPEGCLYEMMQNVRDLLQNYCQMDVPPAQTQEEYLAKGPLLFALLHPGLGPLYSIVAQKIQKGSIQTGSSIVLEITQITLHHLTLNGSLHIEADAPLGKKNEEGIICYNNQVGRCTLRNVTVLNKGIDRDCRELVFWKNSLEYKERCAIFLKGNAEFYAENVTFQGDFYLVVPDGHRMEAYEKNGALCFRMHPIKQPKEIWEYAFDEKDRIILKKSS